ncbi:hypothetical protein AMAG_01556 [Allomyces macrogynus ATCC 38327]|uniref:Dipeptidyl-peptidase IV n=1 Tax=Allomyces macrogynus (strain ATCC 38327) TaxID=578462 RepID=A0A0L0RZB6_ALLM3|nr:hypothetical protein AMAG_01556 [Allomyces macrogynus ATCC 38327]|eukprot:KNE55668.1 hypothetical protein AMAG_01556 [Allomyces macrogynus ATCC 38327]
MQQQPPPPPPPHYPASSSPPGSPPRNQPSRVDVFRGRTPKSFQTSVVDLGFAPPPLPPAPHNPAMASPLAQPPAASSSPTMRAVSPQPAFLRGPSPPPVNDANAARHRSPVIQPLGMPTAVATSISPPRSPVQSTTTLFAAQPLVSPFASVPSASPIPGQVVNLYSSDDHEDGVDERTDFLRSYSHGGDETPPKIVSSYSYWAAAKRHWKRNLGLLAVAIVCLVLTVSAWSYTTQGAAAPPSKRPPPTPPPANPIDGRKSVTIDDIFTGKLHAQKSSVAWLKGGRDGDFVRLDAATGNLIVQHIETNEEHILVPGDKLRTPDGKMPLYLPTDDYSVSPDRKFVLFPTRKEKLWRHSSTAEYVIYDVDAQRTFPMTESGRPASVRVARWAPKGHNIAFVRDNDLYLVVDWKETRITFDGSATVQNGVPDWVYEEEVLATNVAFYWAPDGNSIAWLRFDDKDVPLYSFPYYFDAKERKDAPYPSQVALRPRIPWRAIKKPGDGAFSVVSQDNQHLNATAAQYALPGVQYTRIPVPVDPAAPNGATVDVNAVIYTPPGFDPKKKYPVFMRVYGGPNSQLVQQKWDATPVAAVPLPPAVTQALGTDVIYGSVLWVGPTLLVKVLNRIQNQQRVVAVTLSPTKVSAVVVREIGSPDGWLELNHQWTPVVLGAPDEDDDGAETDAPVPPRVPQTAGYVDLVNIDGFTHVGYFATAKTRDPVMLTKGDWQVVAIKGVDPVNRRVYLVTTQHESTQRALAYVDLTDEILSGTSVKIATADPPLVDARLPRGYYQAQFSTFAQFYWVAYEGPGIPWQAIKKPGDGAFSVVLQDNQHLNATAAQYALPGVQYTRIPVPVDPAAPNGATVDVNAVIYTPPGFDPKKKYPVFMRVYGGPNSQLVQQKWDVDLHTYLASNRSMVCVVVDGRGTGFRGLRFRNAVYRRLGDLEAADQVNAAKWLAAQPWVDAKRIGIWGWSYGGYMASKVVERNVEGVFQYAIAVAPVTDWRFYDSVYTERYMSTPTANPQGYKSSAVNRMLGFKRTRFLLVHGSGDDNVHVQQAMALLYALMDRYIGHVVFGQDEYEVELVKRGVVAVL